MTIFMIGQKGIPATGGGVERHVEELATRLAHAGHDVFVYARKRYTKDTPETYKGVNILYTPAFYTKHLEAISHTLFSILNVTRKKADIIHVHGIGPSLLIPAIKLLNPRTKIVATVHCADYFHQKWGRFARFSLRLGEAVAAHFADEVITVSKNLKHYLWNAYHCEAEYIPNGVNLPELGTETKHLTEWNLEPQEYIVAVSRLIRHKGLHYLIEAYKKIDTTKKLVIVGDGKYTDDYVKELHQRAKDCPNIIFTGNQTGKALQELFEHAYTFVQPSQSEGLSIALLEALSYNQAVLASDIPENTEVLQDTGLTFKQADIADLANKLQFMVSHPEIVKQYKQGGRELVEKDYNWKDITKKTIRVYKRPKRKTKMVTITKQVQA